MIKRTLTIYSNLWSAVDHEGRPCGAYPYRDVRGRFIGATYRVQGYDFQGNPIPESIDGSAPSYPISDVVWTELDDAVTVALDAYYLDGIRDGVLIPADQATADAAGVPLVPVAQARAASKKRFASPATTAAPTIQNASTTSASSSDSSAKKGS